MKSFEHTMFEEGDVITIRYKKYGRPATSGHLYNVTIEDVGRNHLNVFQKVQNPIRLRRRAALGVFHQSFSFTPSEVETIEVMKSRRWERMNETPELRIDEDPMEWSEP
jgi:hypothetical protein